MVRPDLVFLAGLSGKPCRIFGPSLKIRSNESTICFEGLKFFWDNLHSWSIVSTLKILLCQFNKNGYLKVAKILLFLTKKWDSKNCRGKKERYIFAIWLFKSSWTERNYYFFSVLEDLEKLIFTCWKFKYIFNVRHTTEKILIEPQGCTLDKVII